MGYNQRDKARVLNVVTHNSSINRVTSIRDLAIKTGLASDVIRAILSDADGQDMVFGTTGEGSYIVANTSQEAERFTRQLETTIEALQARVARRRAYPWNQRRVTAL